ncbi:MAG TPA: heat-inducible transcriptional repressor HrcA [Ferrovibrio sp.]|uniref:heat-inducible transcriptional repressor HrcA n=1 Tax=Ferrovibrio sp. TaxID=1917215 RepID=UPI002B4B2A01|nr:heat-inducible transcriptional repressor HrcA [Ferrovibrio sp.]HLT76651.1 heat-inducible transcriptional repressor HrcA [Ferrovibrio sp.]
MIQEMSLRSREILRLVVETYMATGEPVGSRVLSKKLEHKLSPASIRNTMADLEEAGLLFSPHTSAGRLPTESGLRLFVDGLLQVGDLTQDERESIQSRCAASGRGFQEVLTEATTALSGLSGHAGLVVAPKADEPLRHVEFVPLGPGKALVVMVSESGQVENRMLEMPMGMTASALAEAGQFLSQRLKGRTMGEARDEILTELQARRAELDQLAARVVEAGLAVWGGESERGTLIVRGSANLLGDVAAIADLERIRNLMEELENTEEMLRLIELTQGSEGVRIFIGSENTLFRRAGCSLIVAPLQNQQQRIVGAIGVIGPTRMNYARVVPMVDFTAQVVGRLIG